jgi:uncharacterized protein YndB with AHSA1/START domain
MNESFSIVINSPPATVFGWLEKPEKAVKWMTSVTKTEILNETPERIGTTFREVVEKDGNGVELHGAITDYKPNRSISFRLDSRVNVVDVEYCVEAIPNGMRLTQTGNVTWKFPVNVISLFIGGK